MQEPIHSDAQTKKEGLREQKRRETKKRIAEKGLRLFIANGYEGTTLEAIAKEAAISRRTFFYYFKSKEEILSTWQNGAWDTFRADLIKESPNQVPIDVVYKVFLRHISSYETDEMIIIDRLLRSSESLQGRKQANYEAQEQSLFIALCELWPQTKRRAALRLVAMVSIGAMRLATEAWNEDWAKRPIKEYLQEAFATLKGEF